MNEETIIRFLQGKSSIVEIQDLSAWIEASEEHRRQFDEIRTIWLQTSDHASAGEFDATKGWNTIEATLREKSDDRTARPAGINARRILRYAAVLVSVFALGALLTWMVFPVLHSGSSAQYVEVKVPQGSRSQVTLPDGSVVWLNAGSRLSYPQYFNDKDRTVSLEGEGYFDVQSNAKKPFIVQTSHLDVKALGTVFNVKAYPDEDEIVTTLVEGKVVVENKAPGKDRFVYKLAPAQNITYYKSSERMSSIGHTAQDEQQTTAPAGVQPPERAKLARLNKHVNTELYTSWKDDNWVVEGVTLNDFAKMLERRYNTSIRFQSDAIRDYRFTGTIRKETLEQVLEIVRLTAPVDYEIGKGWVEWDLDPGLQKKYDALLN
jgi:ferric-dicitrate binding protein FerR (iron transport regulator)